MKFVLKRIKNSSIILFIFFLAIFNIKVCAINDAKLYTKIKIPQLGDKTVDVYTCGSPNNSPALVLGPATLFRIGCYPDSGCLPEFLCESLYIYFVDVFLKEDSVEEFGAFIRKKKNINAEKESYSNLDTFVEITEHIRAALRLDNLVLLGHSANGILAFIRSTRIVF